MHKEIQLHSKTISVLRFCLVFFKRRYIGEMNFNSFSLFCQYFSNQSNECMFSLLLVSRYSIFKTNLHIEQPHMQIVILRSKNAKQLPFIVFAIFS